MNNRIKKLREKLNLSQEEFGNAIGLTRSGVSNIENGLRSVSERHIKLLHSAFRVNENWLRTGEGGDDPIMDEPSRAALDQVADQYNLGELERLILETFITMPESDRRAFADIVHRATERINSADYRDIMETDVTAAISEAKKQSADQAAQAQTE